MSDIKGCLGSGMLRRCAPDEGLARNMLLFARNRQESARRLALDEVTAVAIITLLYDALRATLEAQAAQAGWKVYNHECYAALLKEAFFEEDLAERFDRMRKVRNDLSYYGNSLPVPEAQRIGKELQALIKQARTLRQK